MTIKENNILNNQYIDFDIFVTSDENLIPESNQFRHLVVFQGNKEVEQLKSFLEKILQAAKVDVQKDVFLINADAKERFRFIDIKKKAPIEFVLFFGVHPKQFGLNFQFQKYQPFQFNNCHFLVADDLSAIQENKQLKGALWNSLKSLYKL